MQFRFLKIDSDRRLLVVVVVVVVVTAFTLVICGEVDPSQHIVCLGVVGVDGQTVLEVDASGGEVLREHTPSGGGGG